MLLTKFLLSQKNLALCYKKTKKTDCATEAVNAVITSLQAMRTDEQLDAVWHEVAQRAGKINRTPLQLPRIRHAARRIDDGCATNRYADVVTYHQVETWYGFTDVVRTQIDERFSVSSFE